LRSIQSEIVADMFFGVVVVTAAKNASCEGSLYAEAIQPPADAFYGR